MIGDICFDFCGIYCYYIYSIIIKTNFLSPPTLKDLANQVNGVYGHLPWRFRPIEKVSDIVRNK